MNFELPQTATFAEVEAELRRAGMVIRRQDSGPAPLRVTVSMISIGEKYPSLDYTAKAEKAEAIAYYTTSLPDAYETGLRMSREFHEQVHLEKEPTMPEQTYAAANMRGLASTSAQLSPSTARISERLLSQAQTNGANLNDLQNMLEDTCRRLTGGLPDWPATAGPPSHAPEAELTLLEQTEQHACGHTSMINRCLDLVGYINTHC